MAEPAACDYCGEQVWWVIVSAVGEPVRWFPYEEVATAEVLVGARIKPMPVVEPHTCNGYEKARELRQQSRAIRAAEAKAARLKVYADAMQAPCPRCGAAAGDRCANLVERRRGKVKFNSNPHKERIVVNG